MSEENISFEKAFERLEEILQLMNSGKISLDDSLKLFQEADEMILKCGKYLNNAEQKIEILLKNREGELLLDEKQKPQVEEFAHTADNIFTSKE
jgi:exodeoxyribonuclease VII small subunit